MSPRSLILALACLLAAGWWQVAGAATELRQASFVMSDGASPPPDEAPWQPIELPDRWSQRRPEARGSAWYRMRFEVAAAPRDPWMIYLPYFRDGGHVFVNGRLVASVRQADARTYVRWLAPQGFRIPPSMLSVGPNTIEVHVVVSVPGHTMYPPMIGDEAEVRPFFETRRFWSHETARVMVFGTLVVGVLVLTIWIRRAMAFDYGLFGVAAVCWGIRTLSLMIPVYPMALWMPWRVLHYATTGGFVIAMALFMLRFAQLRSRPLERILVAYWPTGPLLLALGGAPWYDFVDRYYQAALIPVALATLFASAWACWRQRSAGALALFGAVLFSFALGAHDYLVSQELLSNERGFLMHLGANALLLVIGALLADRFVRSLRQVESAAEALESKVHERELELAANYERLRRLERERAADEERQRIMQDMHDGLGSQLLTSLAMVERGALDRDGMATALREAIDELRLAIDTLSPSSEGFAEAFANLAWRLTPRFAAAGIELRFNQAGAPERIAIPADDSLQLLRILQEALSNVLKHAKARRVDVALALLDHPPRLELSVTDDGHGFEPSEPCGAGRGLAGMRRRAERIGAALSVSSGATGTRLGLAMPLPQPGTPGLSRLPSPGAG